MKKNTIAAAMGSCLLAAGLAACGSSSPSSSTTAASSSGPIIGAGSTLVAPLMSTWSTEYEKKSKVTVTYGPIGSGGGIAQITARTVDFGASDAPLTEDQFKEAKGVFQIPWALAATVVAYHVDGVPNKLKLTGPLLAEIWEGKITTWNDSKIAALNPGVSLPATKIVPIHRTDGSGDTYAFTNYLSHVSPEWSSKIGKGTEVAFPGGIGGKGNSGVGGAISSTNGAIGYIAIAYVIENKFDFAEIQNAAGEFPEPNVASISAAAKSLTSVPANNEVSIVDPPASAKGAYPISTFTYSLVPEKAPKASELKPFLKWAITEGQPFGEKLEFAPLPEIVVKASEKTIEKITS